MQSAVAAGHTHACTCTHTRPAVRTFSRRVSLLSRKFTYCARLPFSLSALMQLPSANRERLICAPSCILLPRCWACVGRGRAGGEMVLPTRQPPRRGQRFRGNNPAHPGAQALHALAVPLKPRTRDINDRTLSGRTTQPLRWMFTADALMIMNEIKMSERNVCAEQSTFTKIRMCMLRRKLPPSPNSLILPVAAQCPLLWRCLTPLSKGASQ